MNQDKEFRVLFASDGSTAAKAAVRTGVQFPWPRGARGYGVVARHVPREVRLSILLSTLDRTSESVAQRLNRALTKRWPMAAVSVVETAPVDGILAEAHCIQADAIVVGWRGHGPVRRLLAGSVSRGVVRSAACPVLVVHRSRPVVRRIVVGFDGSGHSRAAVELVARLAAPPGGGRVTLLTALESLPSASHAFMLSASAEAAAEVYRLNENRAAKAQRDLEAAGRRVVQGGWEVDTVVTAGAPLRDLLSTVGEKQADLLVVGARGTSGIAQLLLGSVAEGALNRSPVPVLLVR